MLTRRKTTIPKPWTCSTARRRCPICGKSKCLIAGTAAAVCRNVTSDQAVGSFGHLHVLSDGPTWAPWRLSLARLARMETTR